ASSVWRIEGWLPVLYGLTAGVHAAEGGGRMIAVPSADPVGALVPHTLKEPLIGGSSGPLAGTSFMVKDLFAIKAQGLQRQSPFLWACDAGTRDRAGHHAPARGRRIVHRHNRVRRVLL